MSSHESLLFRVADAGNTLGKNLIQSIEAGGSSVMVSATLLGKLVPIPFTDDEARYTGLIDSPKAYFAEDQHADHLIKLLPEVARIALGVYFESYGNAVLEDVTYRYELSIHVPTTTNKNVSPDSYDLVLEQE